MFNSIRIITFQENADKSDTLNNTKEKDGLLVR